jgi:hypothetical protein
MWLGNTVFLKILLTSYGELLLDTGHFHLEQMFTVLLSLLFIL